MPNLSKAYLGGIPLFNQIETKTNYYDPNIWNRPSGWLAIPSVIGQQKFIGLHKVNGGSNGNHVTIRMSGDFCVEWGDGTSGTYSAGSLAFKNLDYNSYSSIGEDILGYRQALISAYPISGSDLNSLDLTANHPDFEILLSKQYNTKWLDIYLNAPSLVSGSSLSISQTGNCPRNRYIEQATIYNFGNAGSLNYEFFACSNLKSVILGDTSKITSAIGMFSGCSELITAPNFNTSNVTNATAMFRGCTSLKYLPKYDLTKANCRQLFQGCTQLESVTGFVVSGACSDMFASCTNLNKVSGVIESLSAQADSNLIFSSNPNLSEVFLQDMRTSINLSGSKLNASGLNVLFESLGGDRSFFATGASGSTTIRVNGMNTHPFTPVTNNSLVFFRNISGGQPFNESTIYTLKTTTSSGVTLTTGVTTNAAIALTTQLSGAELRFYRTVRVSQNYGTSEAGYNPSIATGKYWTVLN